MDNCAVPHPYHWRCQIFRSITSDSAVFEPEKTKVLNAKKGRLVDASIGEETKLKNYNFFFVVVYFIFHRIMKKYI